MKKSASIIAIASLLVATVAIAQSADTGVTTLRNGDLDGSVPLENMYKQDEQRFVRNYRQQPPLVAPCGGSVSGRSQGQPLS